MYSELSGLRPSQFGWIGDEFQGFTKLSTSSDRNSGDICFDAMWLFVFIGKYPATLIQPQIPVMEVSNRRRGCRIWRFPSSLLEQEAFKTLHQTKWDNPDVLVFSRILSVKII